MIPIQTECSVKIKMLTLHVSGDLISEMCVCVCACAVFADWPVALRRGTVHGEGASINQCDGHAFQHHAHHHNNFSKNPSAS